MELPNLPNSDVWRIIRFYLQHWGKIKQDHTYSHIDDYIPPEDLDDNSIHDIMADHLADEYYHPDQPSVNNKDLTYYLLGCFAHKNQPITIPFRKWAQE
jgi:hypothetical protein